MCVGLLSCIGCTYKIVTQLSLYSQALSMKNTSCKAAWVVACEILVRKASYNGLLCLLYLLGLFFICCELPVCCIDAINHIVNYVQLSHDAIRVWFSLNCSPMQNTTPIRKVHSVLVYTSSMVFFHHMCHLIVIIRTACLAMVCVWTAYAQSLWIQTWCKRFCSFLMKTLEKDCWGR